MTCVRAVRAWAPVLLLAWAVGPAASLFAQTEEAPLFSDWRPFGLQGMRVNAIAAVPARVCAGTQGRGVFCLDPRVPRPGWKPAGLEGVNVTGLWIDPTRPAVMFAGTDGAFDVILMFRTFDGGVTWEPIGANVPFPQSGIRVMSLVHGVPGTGTVFAAGGSIWRSDDLGDTWREVYPQAWQAALDVAPTDPDTIWAGGDVAFAFVPTGYTVVSRDGGATWQVVWTAGFIDYHPSLDAAAHPAIDGLTLLGYGDYVLRTEDHGATFTRPLRAPLGFRVDWGADNWGPLNNAGGIGDAARFRPGLAFAAGSPLNTAANAAESYLSRDAGITWIPVTGRSLAPRAVFELAADARWPGVAYAGTDDGVYIFFGAGAPLCHDARPGVEETLLWFGVCPPILAPGPARIGDAIAVLHSGVVPGTDQIDLGMAHCLVQDSDIAFATIDPPDPPPGDVLYILAREDASNAGYGTASDGRPRVVADGDCL